jgi:BNR repeat-containing family member
MGIRASLAGAMVCAIVALLASVATGAPTPKNDPPPPSVVIRPGGWSYFADPRALRYGGADHAGWTTMDGKIQVAQLNGAATHVDTLAKGLRPDDHSSPALARLPGGPLAVFWSPHVEKRAPDWMFYRVRVRGRWTPRRKVATNSRGKFGYAYPNPVRVGDRMMLFFRGGNYQPTYSATRDGRTWSQARTLLTGPAVESDYPTARERPYVKYYANNGIVHVAYNEAHPNRRRTSLFYIRMRGSRIVGPDNVVIDRRPLRWDQGSSIYDGDRGSAWVMDVGATASASPVIVYVRQRTRLVQYRYVTYKDGHWQDRPICLSPRLRGRSYPGGITIDHADPRVLYVSRKVDRRFEVEAWATADDGLTWATEPITADSPADSVRPTHSLGGKAVLWMTGKYTGYRHFNTRIVIAEARARAAERRKRERAGSSGA